MIDANILNEKEAVKAAPAPVRSVEVRATKVGFHGEVKQIGAVFSVPAGTKGSWFVPVEKPAAAKAKGNVLNDDDLA